MTNETFTVIKAFVAHGTLERFLYHMCSLVYYKNPLSTEAFSTLIAFVRFFSWMCPQVESKSCFLSKAFGTLSTLKWSHTSTGPLDAAANVTLIETLIIFSATILPYSVVSAVWPLIIKSWWCVKYLCCFDRTYGVFCFCFWVYSSKTCSLNTVDSRFVWFQLLFANWLFLSLDHYYYIRDVSWLASYKNTSQSVTTCNVSLIP